MNFNAEACAGDQKGECFSALGGIVALPAFPAMCVFECLVPVELCCLFKYPPIWCGFGSSHGVLVRVLSVFCFKV